jgi:hypothetical protein
LAQIPDLAAKSLGTAFTSIADAGRRLILLEVSVPQRPQWGELTGAVTTLQVINEYDTPSVTSRWDVHTSQGRRIYEPPDLFPRPTFVVESGHSCTTVEQDAYPVNCLEWDNTPPCSVSEGGRCVGRPDGYMPNEDCEIAVVGANGVLGECPVFDTSASSSSGEDFLATQADLGSSGRMNTHQGGGGCSGLQGLQLAPGQTLHWNSDESTQGASPPNGHHSSVYGIGGGWQICFV